MPRHFHLRTLSSWRYSVPATNKLDQSIPSNKFWVIQANWSKKFTLSTIVWLLGGNTVLWAVRILVIESSMSSAINVS